MEVTRTGVLLRPNNARVLYRPFEPPQSQRAMRIIGRVMALDEQEVERLLGHVLSEFHGRHQRLVSFFGERFESVRHHLLTDQPLSNARQLLIGSYFTQEYALESSALFNPSIVLHPDQSDLGPGMARFTAMRQALTEGRQSYRCLDAVQLVKHAYGLRTQSVKRGLGAVLVYLHAAPTAWASGKAVAQDAIALHEAEITDFARAVKGDAVTFVPLRWADLLAQWSGLPLLADHAAAIRGRFGPL